MHNEGADHDLSAFAQFVRRYWYSLAMLAVAIIAAAARSWAAASGLAITAVILAGATRSAGHLEWQRNMRRLDAELADILGPAAVPPQRARRLKSASKARRYHHA